MMNNFYMIGYALLAIAESLVILATVGFYRPSWTWAYVTWYTRLQHRRHNDEV